MGVYDYYFKIVNGPKQKVTYIKYPCNINKVKWKKRILNILLKYFNLGGIGWLPRQAEVCILIT
jgi:hypothetical protein